MGIGDGDIVELISRTNRGLLGKLDGYRRVSGICGKSSESKRRSIRRQQSSRRKREARRGNASAGEEIGVDDEVGDVESRTKI